MGTSILQDTWKITFVELLPEQYIPFSIISSICMLITILLPFNSVSA